MKSYKFGLFFVVGILFVVSGCGFGPKKLQRYRETKLLMGTVIHVDVCHSDADEDRIAPAYREVWDRLKDIHWRMSVFDDRSDVWKVNRSFQAPALIGADTYEVVKKGIEISERTNGAFDITVWPLIKLWKDAAEKQQMPTKEQIEAAKAMTGPGLLKFYPDNRIEVLNPDARIDLGGIAKGYGVDEAARILRAHGLNNFFIDAGGDVYVGGRNCQGKAWRVGVRDPRDKTSVLDIVFLENMAVTTSGDYERFIEIGGQRFSHIINPVTGFPQKDVVSATVIAPTAMMADAFSTSLCVLGPKEGIELFNSMGPDLAAFVILKKPDGTLEPFHSESYSAYTAER